MTRFLFSSLVHNFELQEHVAIFIELPSDLNEAFLNPVFCVDLTPPRILPASQEGNLVFEASMFLSVGVSACVALCHQESPVMPILE